MKSLDDDVKILSKIAVDVIIRHNHISKVLAELGAHELVVDKEKFIKDCLTKKVFKDEN